MGVPYIFGWWEESQQLMLGVVEMTSPPGQDSQAPRHVDGWFFLLKMTTILDPLVPHLLRDQRVKPKFCLLGHPGSTAMWRKRWRPVSQRTGLWTLAGKWEWPDSRAKGLWPCEVDGLNKKTSNSQMGWTFFFSMFFLSVMYDIIMSKALGLSRATVFSTVCHSFPAHLDGRSRNISKTWENRRNTWLYGWIVTATWAVWAGFEQGLGILWASAHFATGASKVLRLMDLYDPLCSHYSLWISSGQFGWRWTFHHSWCISLRWTFHPSFIYRSLLI